MRRLAGIFTMYILLGAIAAVIISLIPPTKKRNSAIISAEAHDVFGPEICHRREWPTGLVAKTPPCSFLNDWSIPNSEPCTIDSWWSKTSHIVGGDF